jgi:hypothetical protein
MHRAGPKLGVSPVHPEDFFDEPGRVVPVSGDRLNKRVFLRQRSVVLRRVHLGMRSGERHTRRTQIATDPGREANDAGALELLADLLGDAGDLAGGGSVAKSALRLGFGGHQKPITIDDSSSPAGNAVQVARLLRAGP